MINTGYAELTTSDGAVVVRAYYDQAWLPAHPGDSGGAPLINGPRGYCLDITNTSGGNQKVTITLPNGTSTVVTFGQGDPVTTGPASGRSQTAAQLAAIGYTTRGDIAGIGLG